MSGTKPTNMVKKGCKVVTGGASTVRTGSDKRVVKGPKGR